MKFDEWPRKTIRHLFYAASSFVHHFIAIGVFKLELRVPKRSIQVKIGDFLSCVILKLDGWPRKIIGHLFYTMSNFVHHFKSISEVKLELQSGNAQFRSKLAIFLSSMTLKIDGWPWKTIGHLSYAASNFRHNFIAIGEFKLELRSGNAQFRSKSTNF